MTDPVEITGTLVQRVRASFGISGALFGMLFNVHQNTVARWVMRGDAPAHLQSPQGPVMLHAWQWVQAAGEEEARRAGAQLAFVVESEGIIRARARFHEIIGMATVSIPSA